MSFLPVSIIRLFVAFGLRVELRVSKPTALNSVPYESAHENLTEFILEFRGDELYVDGARAYLCPPRDEEIQQGRIYLPSILADLSVSQSVRMVHPAVLFACYKYGFVPSAWKDVAWSGQRYTRIVAAVAEGSRLDDGRKTFLTGEWTRGKFEIRSMTSEDLEDLGIRLGFLVTVPL